jgi:hypothetical protein
MVLLRFDCCCPTIRFFRGKFNLLPSPFQLAPLDHQYHPERLRAASRMHARCPSARAERPTAEQSGSSQRNKLQSSACHRTYAANPDARQSLPNQPLR